MNKCPTNIFIHITLTDNVFLRKYSLDTVHVENLSKMPKCKFFDKFQVRSTTLKKFSACSFCKIVFKPCFTFLGLSRLIMVPFEKFKNRHTHGSKLYTLK